ncbi:hypothetical protein H311_01378 [Anncaliia algerae PRA109]|nr:hypothetical protein H311_01378 [Anncaliia algerae PRA109]
MLSGKIIRSEQINEKIGGIGHIVRIYESKFSKRKYNVGRTVRSPWIVGGIVLNTEKVFFVEIISRDSRTLTNIILENIIQGTTIYTDKWKGYSELNNLGYIHQTVNHSSNFIDPISGANTQLIESTWHDYKKDFRSRGINSKCNISDHFYEFMLKKNMEMMCLKLF